MCHGPAQQLERLFCTFKLAFVGMNLSCKLSVLALDICLWCNQGEAQHLRSRFKTH